MLRSIVVILLFIFLAVPVKALGLEQHINFLDREIQAATSAATPGDNSAGMVRWQDNVYSDAAVYFEALMKCDNCTGGNQRAQVTLNRADNTNTVSTLNTTSNSYTLVRSANILSSLTHDMRYTVNVARDATGGTASFKAARFVIVQNAAHITNTENQIEIGNYASTSNTAYELMSAPKLVYYEPSAFAPTPTMYFEATLKSTSTMAVAYAGLSSSATCSSIVSGSEITTSNDFWTLVRSGPISLSRGTYFICLKTNGEASSQIANGKLILRQADGYSITKTQSHLQMINALTTHNTNTFTSQNYPIEFTKSNFTGTDAHFNYYFAATIKTGGGTGYARPFNSTDGSLIGTAQVETTGNGYSYMPTTEIGDDLPATTKLIDTQLSNSGTDTTSVSASSLIVNISVDPALTFTIEGVAAGTTTNGIVTSSASQFNKLDFDHLITSIPRYLAHRLTVQTNAGDGYTVTLKMKNTLQGNYPANLINEFPASWATPTTWTEPTGEVPNVNTGWFGANTSDTRVSGWSSGSGLFGGVGTVGQVVMQSTGTDAGTSAYVTYALEVNRYQPTDLYAGTIVYNIVPTY